MQILPLFPFAEQDRLAQVAQQGAYTSQALQEWETAWKAYKRDMDRAIRTQDRVLCAYLMAAATLASAMLLAMIGVWY